MNCPICNTSDLAEKVNNCPSCGSDLQAFQHLQHAARQRTTFKRSAALLAVTTIIALIALATLQLNPSEHPASSEVQAMALTETPVQNELSELRAKLEARESQLVEMEAEIASLNTSLQAKSDKPHTGSMHIVQSGENLWRIAAAHFGDGFQYSVLAEKNHVANADHIEIGDTIFIQH